MLDVKRKPKSAVLVHGVLPEQAIVALKKLKPRRVFVMEGRPDLSSGRTMSRKLLERGITPTVISDNMAGFLFSRKYLKEVWLSYDYRASSGLLCPIGSLILGVLGRTHCVPVVCYPSVRKSGFFGCSGQVTAFAGCRIAPRGVPGYVPLMELVPRKYLGRIYE